MKSPLLLIALLSLVLIAAKPTPSIAVVTAAPTLGETMQYSVANIPGGFKVECNYSGSRCLFVGTFCYIDKDGDGLEIGGFTDTLLDDLVYGENVEAEYAIEGFLLGGGGSRWLYEGGGDAFCIAHLFYWDSHGVNVVLASTSFSAGG
jgi:hypothetical protein